MSECQDKAETSPFVTGESWNHTIALNSWLSLLRLGLQGALRTMSLAVLLDLHFAQITGFSRLKAITKIPREDTQNPNGTKMTL